MPIISAAQEMEVEGSQSWADPGKNVRLHLKTNQSKRDWGHGSSGVMLVQGPYFKTAVPIFEKNVEC
jgi:hypothetical protein